MDDLYTVTIYDEQNTPVRYSYVVCITESDHYLTLEFEDETSKSFNHNFVKKFDVEPQEEN